MAETLIAVMGATGTGKSTFVNLVSGSNLAVGEGLKSCTMMVQMSKTFWFEGRQARMIDTPGFDDTTRTDNDILKEIANYLSTSYQRQQRLSGIIYMHRISDPRMNGISRRNFSMFRTLCGDTTLQNVVLVTNMWGEVGEQVGAAREHELATDDLLFKPVLDRGARMRRHYNTVPSGQDILRLLAGSAPAVLQIQDELVNQHKALEQTSAGMELNREFQEELRKHQLAMEQAQRDMAAAAAAREEQARMEREQAKRAADEEAARNAAAHAQWVARQEAERLAAEQRAREAEARLQEEVRLAREREAEVQRLQAEAQRAAQQWAAEQERMMQERERLERMQRRRSNDCIIS